MKACLEHLQRGQAPRMPGSISLQSAVRSPLSGSPTSGRTPFHATPLNKGKKEGRRCCYTPALDDSVLALLHAESLRHLRREVGMVVNYLPSVRFATVDVRHAPIDAYRLVSDAPLTLLGAQGEGGILAYGNHD